MTLGISRVALIGLQAKTGDKADAIVGKVASIGAEKRRDLYWCCWLT